MYVYVIAYYSCFVMYNTLLLHYVILCRRLIPFPKAELMSDEKLQLAAWAPRDHAIVSLHLSVSQLLNQLQCRSYFKVISNVAKID